MKKKAIHCSSCSSTEVVKNGYARNVQTYLCNVCGRKFSSKRRKKNVLKKHVWKNYVFHKQTMRELGEMYGKDKRTIRALLYSYEPPKKRQHPRIVHIVVDATYYGERKEGTSWCVVVARDHETGEDLVWRFAQTESTSVYRAVRDELEDLGYTIASVTGDGFSGIQSAFSGIPYQMCHVHMERIVTRGTTKNPQTEAGEVLLALTRTLHNTTKKTFTKRLQLYFSKYGTLLDEMTTNPLTGERYRTHKRLRSAAMSLLRLMPWLFTYSANTHIAKTTNSLEGHFSHINEVLAIHRGLSKQQKKKVIHSLLLASTIAPSTSKLDKIL
jgi:hypothetical protein